MKFKEARRKSWPTRKSPLPVEMWSLPLGGDQDEVGPHGIGFSVKRCREQHLYQRSFRGLQGHGDGAGGYHQRQIKQHPAGYLTKP